MRVEIDQAWSSPSTLHVRVVVWGQDDRWRQKFYCALPISEIPPEALGFLARAADAATLSTEEQDVPLF